MGDRRDQLTAVAGELAELLDEALLGLEHPGLVDDAAQLATHLAEGITLGRRQRQAFGREGQDDVAEELLAGRDGADDDALGAEPVHHALEVGTAARHPLRAVVARDLHRLPHQLRLDEVPPKARDVLPRVADGVTGTVLGPPALVGEAQHPRLHRVEPVGERDHHPVDDLVEVALPACTDDLVDHLAQADPLGQPLAAVGVRQRQSLPGRRTSRASRGRRRRGSGRPAAGRPPCCRAARPWRSRGARRAPPRGARRRRSR